MSVYKEGWYAVRIIQNRSIQIEPFSADYGAPVRKGDGIWNWTKQLAEWYGVPNTRQVNTYSTGTTVSIMIRLMNESTCKYHTFRLTYVTTHHHPEWDGYVEVEEVK